LPRGGSVAYNFLPIIKALGILIVMITQHISFSISITVISWIVGMAFNSLLRKTKYYEELSNLNLIKRESLQKAIQLSWFKWVVKNTFFKYFNPKLKLKSKAEIVELEELRKEMTFAELNHLVGFLFVSIFVFAKFVDGLYLFGFIMMIVNILLNLYPSLLQQQNKSRIDRFIKRYT